MPSAEAREVFPRVFSFDWLIVWATSRSPSQTRREPTDRTHAPQPTPCSSIPQHLAANVSTRTRRRTSRSTERRPEIRISVAVDASRFPANTPAVRRAQEQGGASMYRVRSEKTRPRESREEAAVLIATRDRGDRSRVSRHASTLATRITAESCERFS